MKDVSAKILISDIFLDESIYPRENIDHKRIGVFLENLRDGFVFEPIVVQVCPDPEIAAKKGKYRILDGVHRWRLWCQSLNCELATKLRSASYARQADPHGLTQTFGRRTSPDKNSHRFAKKRRKD